MHARRSCCPSVSRRSRIAPARTRAGAETTRPVGRTKPSHSRCARTCGSSFAISSVALGPEVDEAHRLDAPRLHFIEVTDANGLVCEIAVELRKPALPRAHIGFELALLL